MAIITFTEIFHMVIMTVVLGYIFMSYIRRPKTVYDLTLGGFDFDDFKLAIIVTAPAVILHELAHKFVALSYGLNATFKAWFFGLALGVILKLFHSPIIIIAPGFVEISQGASNLVYALIAFAGPAINLILFLISSYVLSQKKRMTRNEAMVWYLTKQINIFLFIFNMLPIPPLDGSKVYVNLFKAIF
jgi:Zn-dependent protease